VLCRSNTLGTLEDGSTAAGGRYLREIQPRDCETLRELTALDHAVLLADVFRFLRLETEVLDDVAQIEMLRRCIYRFVHDLARSARL